MPESERAQILVVEDHRDCRDTLKALLEASGFRVELASNGVEAVEKAVRWKPALILMDVMMPQMDGLQATRLLRQHETTRRTPIIAVTAMEGAHGLALESGADDAVQKPVNCEDLMNRIERLLAAAR